MKRVTREAIKIVTIVRWLAEESGELSLLVSGIEEEDDDNAAVNRRHPEVTETETTAQCSTYICYRYILHYRLIDHR